MFREVRFQTGEVREVAAEIKKGTIPCLEVEYLEEFEIFSRRLIEYGIYKVTDIPYDKNARDRIKEPEFEFRAAFSDCNNGYAPDNAKKLMYIDVYFEADPEESYDPVGEM